MDRNELPTLVKENGVGVELGVSTGQYSDIILKNSKLRLLYSIDSWNSRNHTTEEYISAVNLLSIHDLRSVVMRMDFSEAATIFPNEYFNFIYIDGYAHTGQDDGKTLYDWWPKIKIDGIFSGHDYDDNWNYNKFIVDKFAREFDKKVVSVDGIPDNEWGKAKSWYIIK